MTVLREWIVALTGHPLLLLCLRMADPRRDTEVKLAASGWLFTALWIIFGCLDGELPSPYVVIIEFVLRTFWMIVGLRSATFFQLMMRVLCDPPKHRRQREKERTGKKRKGRWRRRRRKLGGVMSLALMLQALATVEGAASMDDFACETPLDEWCDISYHTIVHDVGFHKEYEDLCQRVPDFDELLRGVFHGVSNGQVNENHAFVSSVVSPDTIDDTFRAQGLYFTSQRTDQPIIFDSGAS